MKTKKQYPVFYVLDDAIKNNSIKISKFLIFSKKN